MHDFWPFRRVATDAEISGNAEKAEVLSRLGRVLTDFSTTLSTGLSIPREALKSGRNQLVPRCFEESRRGGMTGRR
jgi:hypothetical protein